MDVDLKRFEYVWLDSIYEFLPSYSTKSCVHGPRFFPQSSLFLKLPKTTCCHTEERWRKLHNIKVAGSNWLCNRCTPSSDIYLNLSYKTSRAAFCEASNRRSLVCTRIARSRVQSLLLSELHQLWNWKPQTDVDWFVQGRVHGYAGRHHGTECRWLLQWLPQVKNVDKHMNRT